MNRQQKRHPAITVQPGTRRPIPARTLERLRNLQAQMQQEIDACAAALDLMPNAQFIFDEGVIVVPDPAPAEPPPADG